MAVTSGTAKVTLPSDKEILITREFDAPRHLVFKAWTTPEIVEQWWSGNQGTMKSADIDLRVGGRYRYVMESEGTEIAFSGEFREIVENERIVNTEVYEAMPGAPGLNYVTFAELEGGRTRLDLLVVCGTTETRDGIMASGMDVGMQQQMDLLERIAVGLA